ncbi:hypothetical protein [Pseudomonas nitroreducens]|uniref:hypothetical protein n=1 Tax=Pseudomonas nitroreducens TaxID=46680 RepID=UPI003B84952F
MSSGLRRWRSTIWGFGSNRGRGYRCSPNTAGWLASFSCRPRCWRSFGSVVLRTKAKERTLAATRKSSLCGRWRCSSCWPRGYRTRKSPTRSSSR